MSKKVTLGGQRLGSGNRMTVDLHNYERSTHDLSFTMKTTAAPGTLIPFMSEVMLPGDTWDIELDRDVMTQPTIGPLFGSFKVQLDVFRTPIRLYQGKLHNNALNIGMNMSAIKLPVMHLRAAEIDFTKNPDNQQINPSSIFKYLGISGLFRSNMGDAEVGRSFNAVPFLNYWDIYKNYYANKQEEIGAVIHDPMENAENVVDSIGIYTSNGVTILTRVS